MGSSTVVNQGGYYSKTIISDETLTSCNRLNVRADATNNPINIQLPDFSIMTIPASGFIRIEKIDNSANKVVVKPFQNVTACTINGSRNNIELTKQNDSVLLVFDDLFPTDGKYNCSIVALTVSSSADILQINANKNLYPSDMVINKTYTFINIGDQIINLKFFGGLTLINPPTLNGNNTTAGLNPNDLFSFTRIDNNQIIIS